MPIKEGDKLPEQNLLQIGDKGPEAVPLKDKMAGRKIVIFAVPGAYTPTCHSAHVPSFIRVASELKAKGVEEIIGISVNDPFVMKAWGEATGATEAGITLLADPESKLTKAIDMAFTAEPAGLVNRSHRYAMMVEDGVVKILHHEENPGVCEISGGEAMLKAL